MCYLSPVHEYPSGTTNSIAGGVRMTGKRMACVVVLLLCIGISSCAEEQSSSRVVSEGLIAEIDPSWLLPSFKASPDSKHVACIAAVGDKWFVVVDGEEGKQYDDIPGGRGIVFDSSSTLHYLALVGKGLYLVEEEMK
jgi:hypothetical protein